MTPPKPQTAQPTPQHGEPVRRPCPSDGVGNALRAVFNRATVKLPPEMVMLLDKLD